MCPRVSPLTTPFPAANPAREVHWCIGTQNRLSHVLTTCSPRARDVLATCARDRREMAVTQPPEGCDTAARRTSEKRTGGFPVKDGLDQAPIRPRVKPEDRLLCAWRAFAGPAAGGQGRRKPSRQRAAVRPTLDGATTGWPASRQRKRPPRSTPRPPMALGSLNPLAFIGKAPAGGDPRSTKKFNQNNHIRHTDGGAFPLPS